MLLSFIVIKNISFGKNVEIKENKFIDFPVQIDGYIGKEIKMPDVVIEELNTDISIFRNYKKKENESITLYIGYYSTKKGGRTGHHPEACYPGSGWSIKEKYKKNIVVIYNGLERQITVNVLHVAKRGENDKIVYHWYQSNRETVLSNGIEQNLHRFKMRLFNNRNDGAFIRVSTAIKNDIKVSIFRAQVFIKKIYPLIVNYWPIEREV
jgi:EpsI family protein